MGGKEIVLLLTLCLLSDLRENTTHERCILRNTE